MKEPIKKQVDATERVSVFGAGFFGSRLAPAFKTLAMNYRLDRFDVIDRVLNVDDPTVVINCIGHAGSVNVDSCENDIDKTLMSNTFVPIMLAEACRRRKIKLVHISTGCLYHTHDFRPLRECRTPDFYDLFYSRSKIYAERALFNLADEPNILIVRPRIPLDIFPNARNILTKVLAFDKVIDCPNSVTYMPDFIKAVRHLITIDATGIYNVVCDGGLLYSDLLNAYAKYASPRPYVIFNHKDLTTPRTNLILSTDKLKDSGFSVRNINDVLDECVKTYIQNE